jgi:hypothetical protein
MQNSVSRRVSAADVAAGTHDTPGIWVYAVARALLKVTAAVTGPSAVWSIPPYTALLVSPRPATAIKQIRRGWYLGRFGIN